VWTRTFAGRRRELRIPRREILEVKAESLALPAGRRKPPKVVNVVKVVSEGRDSLVIAQDTGHEAEAISWLATRIRERLGI
jgi:hypothetical protein